MIPAQRRSVSRLGVVTMILGMVLLPGIPARADSESRRPEAESFLLHCSGCHQRDGRGTPGVAPDLRTIGTLLHREGGREYLGSVPGVAQAPLDDEALARLLTWVLTEIAQQAPEPAYTAAEIHRLRAHPLRDPLAAREALFHPDP